MNENIGPLAINIPLVIAQILGFLLLIWFLNKFVFKAIFNVLDERQKNIQDVYDQVQQERNEMGRLRDEYEQRLHGIEEEAREKITGAIKEAQVLRDNLISDAQKQAETILQQSRAESERERQKAFLEMRQQIVALSLSAAGKVLGESMNETRQEKLVNDFIASVGTAPPAAGAGPVSRNGAQGGAA